MEVIAEYQNVEEGLGAIIAEGNDKFNYRVVFWDTDANETILVRFKHNYFSCMEDIKEFLLGDFVQV